MYAGLRSIAQDWQRGASARCGQRFADATESSGAGDRGYGMGCAVEFEFSINMTGEADDKGTFNILQMRPMAGGVESFDIDISPDGRTAITPAGSGSAILWDLTLPTELSDVLDWITENRYVRKLTCSEKAKYSIEPLCEPETP